MRTPDDSQSKRIKQADTAFEPVNDLLQKLREKVPQLAKQDPTSRKETLAELEVDLRAAFKVLDDLEVEAYEIESKVRELRRSFADLRRDSRRPPKDESLRRPMRRAKRRKQHHLSTEQDKDKVYAALPLDGGARTTSDLSVVTGFGFAKLRRLIKILEKDGAVLRTGYAGGTRYRVRWPRE